MDEPDGDGGGSCPLIISSGTVDDEDGAGLLLPATTVVSALMLLVVLLAATEALLIAVWVRASKYFVCMPTNGNELKSLQFIPDHTFPNLLTRKTLHQQSYYLQQATYNTKTKQQSKKATTNPHQDHLELRVGANSLNKIQTRTQSQHVSSRASHPPSNQPRENGAKRITARPKNNRDILIPSGESKAHAKRTKNETQ